jgi:hypothetical protein
MTSTRVLKPVVSFRLAERRAYGALLRWSRLSAQKFRSVKWNVCRG